MMNFDSLARRSLRGLGAVLLLTGLLAACGGSTSQLQRFTPKRVVVFGDEISALSDVRNNSNGYQYNINGLDITDTTNATVLCADGNREIWTQRLAAHYGILFKECNPGGVRAEQLFGLMRARYGATVGAFERQIVDFQSDITHDGLNSGDMVTALVGVHDVVEIFLDNIVFTAQGDKIAEGEARGRRVAQQVNAMAAQGARVIVSQIYDVGLTPWALSQGSSEAALITQISNAFNRGLRLELTNDGSKIGLVSLNDIVTNFAHFSGYNTTDLACDELHIEPINATDDDANGYVDGGGVLATCTTATMTSDTAANGNLWADGLRFNSRLVQVQLGNAAISRALNNPF
jgi:hypothetical protein